MIKSPSISLVGNQKPFCNWITSLCSSLKFTLKFSLYLGLFLSLLFNLSLQAQNWSGNGAMNDWTDPLNWDNLTVPAPTDNVSINPNGSNNYPVLTAANNITIAGLNIQPNAEFTIDPDGQLIVTGTINISGTMDNQGTWSVAGLIVNFGGIINSGTANLVNINNAGTVDNSAILNFSDGVTNLGGATMTNQTGGTLTVNNIFSGFGDLVNQSGATLIAAEASISGNTINDGTINIGGSWTNSGDLTNSNIVNVSGTLTHTLNNTFINESGGNINADDLENFGTFTNNSGGNVNVNLLNTSGTFQNLGDLTVVLTVDLGNAGTLINQGTLNITNTFQNFGSGSLQNQGGTILALNVFNFGGMLGNDTNSAIEADVLVNTGSVQNDECGLIEVSRLENGGGQSFQNDGKAIVGNIGFSNPGSTFVNDGLIFDNTVNNIFNGVAGTGIVMTNSPQIFVNGTTTSADPNTSNGAVNITVVGGLPPYTFQWSNGATTEDLAGVMAGDYTVTATDSDNCIVNSRIATFTVELNPSTCLEEGVIALYEFDEGSGNVVHDVSGVGTPLDLTIQNTNNTTWGNGTLTVNSATIIKSASAATKIINACKITNEITIEAWVKPSNNTQSGPARIVTLSQDTGNRNFTLGQEQKDYRARLRTTNTSNNGTPDISVGNTLITSLQHIVFTRSSNGNTAIYVDGVLSESGHRGGDFSTWNNNYQFALANELTNDRAWLGELDRVVIYDRAIIPSEVTGNFFATSSCDQEAPEGCIEANLIALYDFTEGSGNVVNDISGFGSPLNLTIANPSNTSWIGGGGLSVNSATTIASTSAATKIINACKATNEITIEAWVRPDNSSQSGPARIATVSKDTGNRNFTLGQDGDDYVARLRTTNTNNNGMPNISAYNDLVTAIQHVVFTRDADGNTTIYVDGALKDTDTRSGNFSNWDNNYKFALANELTNDRAWKGDFYRVGIYDRALKGAEIQLNFFAGFGCSDETEPDQCVSNGIVALYNFQEGTGNTVYDVSGFSSPVNLTIDNPAKATWVSGGGLDIHSATIVKSAAAASKITNACKATNEITIEAWVKPDNLTQNGPARIATLSANTGNRNFTLGQDDDNYVARLRTTSTNNNGMPDLVAHGDLQTSIQHVVFTRDASGNTRIYVNGSVQHGGIRSGSFSNWSDDYKFALANELTNDRAWLGTMYRVAVYNRAIGASEVNQNYFAGFDCGVEIEPIACVEKDQIALYDFQEGSGNTVNDVSGFGVPLNLTIDNPSNTTWLSSGGLTVHSATIVKSAGIATKIINTCKATNEISIEAWVQPQSMGQSGPARIATLSENSTNRNFTLGQNGNDYIARLRTTSTGNNGTPDITANDDLVTSIQHVVFTRDASGDTRLYVDGIQQQSGTRSGTFNNWSNDDEFALANELTNDRAWLGTYYRVAIYSRALTASEVGQNHAAGFDCGANAPCLPPIGFSSQDINTGFSGSNCYDSATDTHTIQGSGTDIWNSSDGFRYVYEPFGGNGEMVARVTALSQTHPWAKAGVMMRETLNSNSKHASVFITPSNGAAFQYRENTGGTSSHISGGTANTPYWVKLERIGDVFNAYKSADGNNWNFIGSQTVSMSTTIYVGLAVTSHNNSVLTTATIDNVSVNGASKTDNSKELDTSLLLDVYPNPFAEDLNITFNGSAPNVSVTFGLYSLDGRLIQQAIGESNAAGVAKHQFDVKELIGGSYLLVAKNGTTRQSKLLVKME